MSCRGNGAGTGRGRTAEPGILTTIKMKHDADRLMELLKQAREVRGELDELISRMTGVNLEGRLQAAKILEKIRGDVAQFFGITVLDMTGRDRHEQVVWPRHVAMYMMRTMTHASLNEIGEVFGKRDHGTVLAAVKDVQNRCDTSAETLVSVRLIQEILKKKYGKEKE